MSKSSPNMTDSENAKCHSIIHSAAVAAGAVGAGLAQLPMSDNLVIMPIQVAMVAGLGKVFFDERLGEDTIKGLIAAASATVVGRSLSQALIGWIPGVGNVINASTAFTITETIGWAIANKFADDKREAERIEREEAAKEAERIKREEEAAKEAERIKREEEAAKEAERIKALGVNVSESSEEEARPSTVEEAPSSDEEHKESVTVPVQNVPMQNVSPRKTSIVKKVWGGVRSVWSFTRSFVDSVINIIKGLVAFALILQALAIPVGLILLVATKLGLIQPDSLPFLREVLEVIK